MTSLYSVMTKPLFLVFGLTFLIMFAATRFAISMGFKEENLTTMYSEKLWETWKNGSCQPNFREVETPFSLSLLIFCLVPLYICMYLRDISLLKFTQIYCK